MRDRLLAVALLVLAPVASPAQTPPGSTEKPAEAPAATSSKEPRAPMPPPGEMARCKQLIDAGLYGGARARLQPIVEQHPKWARAALLLGLTYYRESRFEAANRYFAQALEADPEEIAVRPLYGWSLYSLGELDAAEKMFESLLKRRPDYTAGHYGLGMIYLDRDQTDAARERFETIAQLAAKQEDPTMEGRAHGRLGELYLRLDDLAAAKRELELAVELFPRDHDALFTLSRVLERLGDAEGAGEARKRFEEVKATLRPERPALPGL